ncbi:MAG: hypothetical protein CMC55_08730 [Flavobacteriaceae bacterium]|nr:hypothetical protein [Flavobacteriaceae bacterium]|tara:strand:+ start:305 stop:799 length:495 start_codon:yes stop_codon:yes gene_type:complete
MKINWKIVAQSEGYKSLKNTMIQAIQDNSRLIQRGHRPMRSKDYFHKHFKWIITRAVSYAIFYRQPLEFILNDWESKRTYCWLNYYQECRQPKPNLSGLVKPKSLKTHRKEDIERIRNAPDKVKRIESINKHYYEISIFRKKELSKRKDKKARWSKAKKLQRSL